MPHTTTMANAAAHSPINEPQTVRIFRFLDLPAEIRLMVYDYVLPDTNRIAIRLSQTEFNYGAGNLMMLNNSTIKEELSPKIWRNCAVQLYDGCVDECPAWIWPCIRKGADDLLFHRCSATGFELIQNEISRCIRLRKADLWLNLRPTDWASLGVHRDRDKTGPKLKHIISTDPDLFFGHDRHTFEVIQCETTRASRVWTMVEGKKRLTMQTMVIAIDVLRH